MDLRRLLGRPGWWAVAALACHLLLLALLPASLRINESSDFVDAYEPTARHLLAGEGLLDAEDRPATRYPPGYPVVVAVAFALAARLPGSEGIWLGVVGAAAIAATGALAFLLARRLVGPRIAPWATALWVTYPPFLWLGKQPNSETPFLPLLLGGLLAWSIALDERDQRQALLAGVLIGLATLVRPVSLLLVLPLALSALIRYHRPGVRRIGVRLGVWALLGHVLVLMPWEIWVHQATGQWLPVSSGGRLSLLDGLTYAVDPESDRNAVPPSVATLMDDIEAHRHLIGGPVSAARFLWDRAGDDPAPVVELLLIKAARCWYGTESLRRERALLVLQIGYLSLAAVGLWLGRGRRREVWMAVLVVGYFWAMATLVLSIVRYLVPVMPLVLPFAAEAVVAVFDRLREGRR
ncbi:MAG: glycosyltransferase family 39 protein [Acidobacteriota bacterium]